METRVWKMPDVGKVTEEEMLNKIQSAKMHNDNMIVLLVQTVRHKVVSITSSQL